MSNKFRFFAAFIYYKLVLVFQKICGRGDRLYPGLTKRAFKICPDFLKKIGKPKNIICVTGTNGKTSACGVIKSMLEADGFSVINNTEWSMPIGISHMFARNVNIFNRAKTDFAVIETDELKSIEIFADVTPDYIVVTNLFRDSLKRNAYPMYIFETLDTAIKQVPNAKLILNSDEPISSFIRHGNNNNVYYGILSNNTQTKKYNANDFRICPKCMSDVKYEYSHYLHLGKVKCTKCEFASVTPDLLGDVPDLLQKQITVTQNGGKFTYPLISQSLFNAFNTLAVITLFRTMGYASSKIVSLLSEIKIPKSREDVIKIDGVTIHSQMSKGQNVSATSSVLEYMSTLRENIQVILLLDEEEGKLDPMETLTWLYDTDFEFLNTEHITKIIVGSKIYKDYIVRFAMTDIPEEKYICVPEDEVISHLDFDSCKTLYILYDSAAVQKAENFRAKVVNFIKGSNKQ